MMQEIFNNNLVSCPYHIARSSLLELRQYKNNSIQSKKIPVLKLPLFFISYTAKKKARQFQNWNYFGPNGVVLILS